MFFGWKLSKNEVTDPRERCHENSQLSLPQVKNYMCSSYKVKFKSVILKLTVKILFHQISV
jgi:hypothetical protein